MNKEQQEIHDLRNQLMGYMLHCDLLQVLYDPLKTPHDCAEKIRKATEDLLQFHALNKITDREKK